MKEYSYYFTLQCIHMYTEMKNGKNAQDNRYRLKEDLKIKGRDENLKTAQTAEMKYIEY